MKACPGHEEICTPTSRGVHAYGGHVEARQECEKPQGAAAGADLGIPRVATTTSEPSDLAVRRSARRLHLLGSRASASRLPGSARPTDGGTRPAGGNARDFFAAGLPCAMGTLAETSKMDDPVDRQLGRISSGTELLMQCIEGVALWLIAFAAIAVACLV